MTTKPTRERGRPAGSGEGYVRINTTITQEQRAWLDAQPNASEAVRAALAAWIRRGKRKP